MSRTFHGRGVSPGLALGPAHLMDETRKREVPSRGAEIELRALDAAVEEGALQLESLARTLREEGHGDEAGIMDAQSLMIRDSVLLDAVRSGIESGLPAAAAVEKSGAELRATFEALDDPYLAARAADVGDVIQRLIRLLTGVESEPLLRPSVIVAHELTPSQTASLDRRLILGLATDLGGPTSHTAILARALLIPAVVGLGDFSAAVTGGEEVALDGHEGKVVLGPDEGERAELAARALQREADAERYRALTNLPAETTDGRHIILTANIGSPDDLDAAIGAGAEGVGLFRTEFLFAGREDVPTEEEQVEAYSAVLSAMSPYTVVVRTLDVGGDKPLPYLPHPEEENPFLGRRGIRYTLAHEDLLRTQLSALLRAAPAGHLAVMLPMVSEVEQIERVRALLDELGNGMGGDLELGIMIEIPAAALVALSLARHSSFFSVGTNDLVQYALAVDRTNPQVAELDRPLHPGILQLLRATVEGGHEGSRWVGVCGELAGDEIAIPLLVGLGFDELSMSPSRIPAAKALIRTLDAGKCRGLAERALACETAHEVEALVRTEIPG